MTDTSREHPALKPLRRAKGLLEAAARETRVECDRGAWNTAAEHLGAAITALDLSEAIDPDPITAEVMCEYALQAAIIQQQIPQDVPIKLSSENIPQFVADARTSLEQALATLTAENGK